MAGPGLSPHFILPDCPLERSLGRNRYARTSIRTARARPRGIRPRHPAPSARPAPPPGPLPGPPRFHVPRHPALPGRARNAPALRASGAGRSLGSLRREVSRTPKWTLARVPPPPPLRSISLVRVPKGGLEKRREQGEPLGPDRGSEGRRAPLDDARGGPGRWGKGAHVPTLRPGLRLPRRPRGGLARSSGAPRPGVGARPPRLGAALRSTAAQPSPGPSLTLLEDPRVQRPPTVPGPKMP